MLSTLLLVASINPFSPCYAYMQVGIDSVINARLGVPVVRILEMNPQEPYFSIMLGAYLLPEDRTPLDYGLKLYNTCMGGGKRI